MKYIDLPPEFTHHDAWSRPGVKAAIDIGTNTILLLVADTESGNVTPLLEMQRAPRLGAGVQQSKVLHPDKMHEAILILHEYRELIAREYGDIPVRVTATSAVRDASNKIEFIWMVEEATGYRIRILTGSEESRFAFTGALSTLDRSDRQVFTIDIGGGSTEIAYKDASGEIKAASYDMGSVRLTERYLGNLPARDQHFIEAQKNTLEVFAENPASGTAPDWHLLSSFKAVGVSGTATSLGALQLGHTIYEPGKLNGIHIATAFASEYIEKIRRMSAEQILHISPVIMQGRHDVILAGLIILIEILRKTNADGFLVSTGGIRHGVLLRADF
ncbi:MAG: exopolyphosphatase / guanosine-5'-triphosphate,3'-diphosphate pyrophosphatase [Bacteroidetes bacterium HLUCCA01]|nr:MAG: exopolyphosphatase / guanosine-5'-triphosphate,3'-diphosphate pyrophosphatase [Bacteroidetes bacterium HLUCCA01]